VAELAGGVGGEVAADDHALELVGSFEDLHEFDFAQHEVILVLSGQTPTHPCDRAESPYNSPTRPHRSGLLDRLNRKITGLYVVEVDSTPV